MSEELSQDENPYASPGYTPAAGVDQDGKIYPAKAPIDALDILIGMANTALVLMILLGVPIGVDLLIESLFNLRATIPFLSLSFTIILMLPSMIWCVSAISRIVNSVTVDEDGLHFQRQLRSRDDWPWDTITAIHPATRWEVTWDGWIRPLLNPRERTSCMSTLGHYRIQGTTDYCFFPPKNPEAFVEAIARYRPELLKPME